MRIAHINISGRSRKAIIKKKEGKLNGNACIGK